MIKIEIAKFRYPFIIEDVDGEREKGREGERDYRKNINELPSWKRFSISFFWGY